MREIRFSSKALLFTPAVLPLLWLSGCNNHHTVKANNPVSTQTRTAANSANSDYRFCPSEVLSPARFSEQTKRELVYEGGFRHTNVPATITWGTKKIQIEPARHVNETEPAQYETVTETVEVLRERYEIRTTPAIYKKEQKRVKTQDAYLRWLPGCMGTARQCTQLVPAEYTSIQRELQETPAITQRVLLPGKTVSVERKVLIKPGKGYGGTIPTRYKTIKVGKVTQPWSITTQHEPSRYEEKPYRKLVRPQTLLKRYAVCENSLKSEQILQLQQQLRQAGMSLMLTSKMDQQTHRALLQYQQQHTISSGALTTETLKKLGLL